MIFGGFGLNSRLTLSLVDRTKDTQQDAIRNEFQHKRALETFRAEIADISTPAEFVKNFEVYSFVMRAFDLEDQIFGKALMRKVLESNPADENSLVNRLSDSRFQDLHDALGFTTSSGPVTPNFSSVSFQDQIVEKYVDRIFINQQSEQNTAVGSALDFREKVDGISNWFDVLKDRQLTLFFQTALGIPSSVSGIDIDKQAAIFESKFDLEKLQDPVEQANLVNRYLLFNDIIDTNELFASNVALQLIRPINFGEQSRNFFFETINIPNIQFSASSLYR